MRRIAPLLALIAGSIVVMGAGSPSPAVSVPVPLDEVTVLVVQLHGADGRSVTPEELEATETVVAARLAALPAPGSTVTAMPDDRLRIDIADTAQADTIRRLATVPGVLAFVPVPPEFDVAIQEGQPLPAGMPAEPLFANEGLASVAVGDDGFGNAALDLQLTADAAEAFDQYAAAHQGERFAIVLDDTVLSAPVLRASDYDGRAQISGGWDAAAAAELVAMLSGGVLPVATEVLEICPAGPACPVPSVLPSPSGDV